MYGQTYEGRVSAVTTLIEVRKCSLFSISGAKRFALFCSAQTCFCLYGLPLIYSPEIVRQLRDTNKLLRSPPRASGRRGAIQRSRNARSSMVAPHLAAGLVFQIWSNPNSKIQKFDFKFPNTYIQLLLALSNFQITPSKYLSIS